MSARSIALAACCLVAGSARAELPNFDELYRGVSECRFDLSRYTDLPMDPYAEAVLIALPNAGAVKGLLVSVFYFSPAREGRGEDYGLVFNAPLEAVADALPELAVRANVNGYLRRLSRLSDETGDRTARNKTLLHCLGGMRT
ncbi:MAG TPA: hypothetical protein VMH32_03015 [Burkholderiales bacterium]|nr:hypothetical protein [Burkholderiales bacterium]